MQSYAIEIVHEENAFAFGLSLEETNPRREDADEVSTVNVLLRTDERMETEIIFGTTKRALESTADRHTREGERSSDVWQRTNEYPVEFIQGPTRWRIADLWAA